ncbi:MAG TPA: multicopper oxidase domain-containing protein [bacterium]|nr:multicopper oxidase domain-containing protein [bacterium]
MARHHLPPQLTTFIGRELAEVRRRLVSTRLPTLTGAGGAGAVRLNPGGTASLEFVPARRGRYAFACTLEGHREAGMSGTLDIR